MLTGRVEGLWLVATAAFISPANMLVSSFVFAKEPPAVAGVFHALTSERLLGCLRPRCVVDGSAGAFPTRPNRTLSKAEGPF